MSNKVKSTTSKSLGEYLLKGYAMLAENCPSCLIPLMRDPKSMDRLCVNCDRVFKAGDSIHDHDEEEEVEEEDEEDEQSLNQAALLTSKSHKPPSDQEKADPSKLLSDKMLQGWALLETCCPVCSTPLARDKAKRMFCVSCDLYVMTEAEAAAKASSATTKAPVIKPLIASTLQVPTATQERSKEVVSPSSPLVDALSQSLLRKLQEATTALDSTSVAKGAAEIKELASMINECAQALKSLRNL